MLLHEHVAYTRRRNLRCWRCSRTNNMRTWKISGSRTLPCFCSNETDINTFYLTGTASPRSFTAARVPVVEVNSFHGVTPMSYIFTVGKHREKKSGEKTREEFKTGCSMWSSRVNCPLIRGLPCRSVRIFQVIHPWRKTSVLPITYHFSIKDFDTLFRGHFLRVKISRKLEYSNIYHGVISTWQTFSILAVFTSFYWELEVLLNFFHWNKKFPVEFYWK